jgi:CRISPR-associated protein Cmr6
MYFPVWGENAETQRVDWGTSDLVPKLKNAQGSSTRTGWEKLSNKQFACAVSAGQTPPFNPERPRLRKPTSDSGLASWRPLAQALAARQSAMAQTAFAQGRLLILDAQAVAPFTTGLGSAHPLENGFAFLNPYGLPYLPGSGVKGVLRHAARELVSGEWGDAQGWTETAMTDLFGLESGNRGNAHQRGALRFWDVLPQLAGDVLQVDVMTPHQNHYYQKRMDERSGSSVSPHDSGQLNPILFLTVPPGSRFAFHVQCDVPFLQTLNPELAEGSRWQALLLAAFEHAFEWLGFGAKTAVGYGAMKKDKTETDKREAEQQRRLEAERRRQQEDERASAIAAMTPADRAMAEFFDRRLDKNQVERVVFFNALKKGELADFRLEVAHRLRALMQEQGRWRETSQKKNPDKDEWFKETQQIKKWLEP